MSFGTSLLHQYALVLETFVNSASEKQMEHYFEKLVKYEIIGSFNVTEPDFGSDANSIQTVAVETNDGFILNGTKKWAANVMIADFYVIYAKFNGNTKAFIVDANLPGVSRKKITGKMSLRAVENGFVYLENVKVEKDCLFDATNSLSMKKALFKTRSGTGIAATGAVMEAFDFTMNYVSNRVQFGKTLTNFQIVQQNLVKCLSVIQAMIYFNKYVYDKINSNTASFGLVSMVKSFSTQNAREILRTMRELLGGNGIISTNLVMGFLVDIESLHTYEGTYEINTLIAGKEITGIQAFV